MFHKTNKKLQKCFKIDFLNKLNFIIHIVNQIFKQLSDERG